MFIKFHAMREDRDERGFTLIELLVVILIIAILAAIAIPVFLRQREKGWVAQSESALANARTAAESWATGDGDGDYSNAAGTASFALLDLEAEGFKYASAVNIDAVTTNATYSIYCVEVSHDNLGTRSWGISSDSTTPEEGTCAAGVFTATP